MQAWILHNTLLKERERVLVYSYLWKQGCVLLFFCLSFSRRKWRLQKNENDAFHSFQAFPHGHSPPYAALQQHNEHVIGGGDFISEGRPAAVNKPG